MGKGEGSKANLSFILRSIALVILFGAESCFRLSENELNGVYGDSHYWRFPKIYYNNTYFDYTMVTWTSTYTIILSIMLIFRFKNGIPLKQKFEGIFSLVGSILLVLSGVALSVKYKNYDRYLVSGILEICAGFILGLHALKNFNIF